MNREPMMNREMPEPGVGLPGFATPPNARDTLRAQIMFALGFVFLLLVAGAVHRATSKSVTQAELDAMYLGLLVLWPVFVAEAAWGVWRLDGTFRRRLDVWRAVLVSAMPPFRMAMTDPTSGLVWIPRLGWQRPGKELFRRLELAFGGPMLLFAFLILPLLALEYFRSEQVKEMAGVALTLDIGIAVVWVAFATEFVFKASVHPKPITFARERWLDVAIVVLPMLEFILTKWVDAAPLARLLRAGRALSPEQIARMQRIYRLQGVATKAWHTLLLLEGISRLLGNTPEKRLATIEERIAELEEQLKETQADADEVRALIAAKEAEKRSEARPPGETDERNSPVVPVP